MYNSVLILKGLRSYRVTQKEALFLVEKIMMCSVTIIQKTIGNIDVRKQALFLRNPADNSEHKSSLTKENLS